MARLIDSLAILAQAIVIIESTTYHACTAKFDRRYIENHKEVSHSLWLGKVTLEDISREAYVSKSTLYNAWKNKESLFETVFDNDWQQFLCYWQNFYQDDNQSYSDDMLESLLSSLSEYALVRRTIIPSSTLYLPNRHDQCWLIIETTIHENYGTECQNALELSRASVLVAYGFATAIENNPIQNISASDWLDSIRATTETSRNRSIKSHIDN